MRAAVVSTLGQPPSYAKFEEPVAGKGEQIVTVTAAAIKPVDRAIVAGKHYASPQQLPVVPGLDGVGRLDDGTLVYFAAFQTPYGAMAERSIATWYAPIPEGLDPRLAAAVVNPALAAWLPLAWRGKILPGETVLIMGATGAAGRMAVTAARLLGAGRVVGAGRRQDVLAGLDLDATVDLRLEGDALADAFRAAAGETGYDLVVDYVWGPATEILIDVLTAKNLQHSGKPSNAGIRIVNVGEMGGARISLPGSALRGAPLQVLGSGTSNLPDRERMASLVTDILGHALSGAITIPFTTRAIEAVSDAWNEDTSDERIVLITGA